MPGLLVSSANMSGDKVISRVQVPGLNPNGDDF